MIILLMVYFGCFYILIKMIKEAIKELK